jgi:predicted acetyltransferase
MREIRPIFREEVTTFLDLVSLSYPGMEVWNQRDMMQGVLEGLHDDPDHSVLWGEFDNRRMVGTCVCYRYDMNYYGERIPVTGIGMVAAGIAHKKEHIAKDILSRYIRDSRVNGAVFCTLYPFRPDFYHKMGFGYGAKVSVYHWLPEQFPFRSGQEKAELLTAEDLPLVRECYRRFTEKHHGMYYRVDAHWKRYMRTPGVFYIGRRKKGRITGYACCHFIKSPKMLDNDLNLRETIWEDADAFYSICAFLNTQADQVNVVRMPLQTPDLPFITPDPRYRPTDALQPLHHLTDQSGIGFMYRSVNNPETILRRRWPNLSGTVRFSVEDDFLPENTGDFAIRFEDGRAERVANRKADASLKLGVQNFSSLVTGSITLSSLREFDLARTGGDEKLLDNLFASQPKPVCWSIF